MKIPRATLVQHLHKLMCRGQVKDAVFSGAFGTHALSPDHQLLVVAPPLPKTPSLPKDIGLANLDQFIKALAVTAAGEEVVELELVEGATNDYLVVSEPEWTLKILVAEPKTIGSRVTDKQVEQIQGKVPAGKGLTLSREMIEGIRSTFDLFKVEEVEVFVGPKGGKIVVGNENSNVAEYESKELKAKSAYSLLFGAYFVDALSSITDFTSAVMKVGGPDSVVVLEDGAYQYLLAPKVRSADEEKAGSKKKK